MPLTPPVPHHPTMPPLRTPTCARPVNMTGARASGGAVPAVQATPTRCSYRLPSAQLRGVVREAGGSNHEFTACHLRPGLAHHVQVLGEWLYHSYAKVRP